MPKVEILNNPVDETEVQDETQDEVHDGIADETESESADETVQDEGQEGEGQQEAVSETASDEQPADADEITVAIGDTPPEKEEKAPTWVTELRKKNRELQRKLHEYEAQNRPGVPQLGAKPKLEDFDYDAAQYETALEGWYAKKREADSVAERIAAQQAKEQEAWQGKLNAYGAAKAALKVKDIDDVESVVQDTLTTAQQAIIVQGAKNPALVVLALGKNPGKLAELKAIANPVEFAFAVANLESQLKVTKRTPPKPETVVNRTASGASAVSSTMDRLRAEAAKTGDFSKVIAYKRQARNKVA